MIRVSEPFHGVIHVTFPTQESLARAFLRMQEYYECAFGNFRDRLFTREEFEAAYAKERGTEECTYYTDWGGFNVPGNSVNKFLSMFEPDSDEKELVEIIENATTCGSRYYVIGTHENAGTTLNHELSHAFWYLHPAYKTESSKLLAYLPTEFYKLFCDNLSDMGYHDDVLDDEIVAYASTSTMVELTELLQSRKIPWDTILVFQEAFDQYLTDRQNGQGENSSAITS